MLSDLGFTIDDLRANGFKGAKLVVRAMNILKVTFGYIRRHLKEVDDITFAV